MAELLESKAYLEKVTNGAKPKVGVICGSGLSGLVNCLDDKLVVKYEDIPHFPSTTIAGHTGELVFGKVDKVEVVLMRGRFHSYEGHDMKKVTLPVKLMRHMGVEILVVTNAAGGINRSFNVGDLMIMDDHLGFPLMAGKNPLLGPNDDTFGGPRFMPMSDAYDAPLRELVYATAGSLEMTDFIHKGGCYCFVSGPNYETGAESRALMKMGGDAVGMSTVPEVTVARHCGMRVIGLSLITNKVRLPGDSGPVASHQEVLDTVKERSTQIETLVRTVIGKLDDETWSKLEAEMTAKAEASPVKLNLSSVEGRLESLDLTNMTPLDAMKELIELKKML